MRVIGKMPYEPAEVIEIGNGYSALQEYVGGPVESYRLFKDVSVVCNKRGKMMGATMNMELNGIELFGPILIVGVDGAGFTDCPNAKFILEYFNVMF